MSTNVVALKGGMRDVPETTYGAMSEANITAFEALMSEVRRTYSHVLWLEHYVSRLPSGALFEGHQFHSTQIAEWEMKGNYPQPGSIAWLLAVDKAKLLGVSQSKRNEVHLGIQQLMKERQHLVSVCSTAIRMGIALDEIEMAKQHGELIVNAMTHFAEGIGLDPTDKDVVAAILKAVDEAQTS